MPEFCVFVITAPPAGMIAEAGGAFVKIDGREALLRSVELFLNRDNVKEIRVVVDADAAEEVKRKYGPHLSLFGVKLSPGGPRWMQQISAVKDKLPAEATHVIVHDAARPIVAYSDIDALMEHAEKHPAVALAAPVRTTLAEVDEGGNPLAFHSPAQFMQVLTPQVFSKEVFLEMATTGQELHPSRLTLQKGSPLNQRVGGSGDAALAKVLIGMLPKPKKAALSNPFEEAQW